MEDFLSDHHIVAGIYPIADAFDTSKTTDWICMNLYGGVAFLIKTGDATGNTANGVVTLLAATDATGTGATAFPFRYRVCASSPTVDTWSTPTVATASGFSMTPGDNVMYLCEVDAADVGAALANANFVALKVTEVTNDPIVADITAILSEPRFGSATPKTAITSV